jgi:hypothetical protein
LCLDANTEVPKRSPYQNSGHQPIPHFKILLLLDINFHWNRRPLTIWRFCWQPFWKWWPRKNDPECKFHHYQPIPHFKILLDINFHWNRRSLTISPFCWWPFWKRGIVKITLKMQFSSLPINSSLQNNPRYQCSLKLENIEILPILSATILKIKITLNAIFIITNQFLTSK